LARKPADQSVSRDQIIKAASNVLQHNGYEAATMKDIAASVNLTAASLYHHFRNKDALMLAVLEMGLEYIIAHLEPIVYGDLPPDRKLRAVITEHLVSLTQNTAVGIAMVFEIRALMSAKLPADGDKNGDHAKFVARRDAFFARRDHFEDLFRIVVREGIDKGVFRSVDVGVFVKTMLGAHNWVGVWYKPEGRLNGKQIAGLIADYFLAALVKK
jgi:AcrR family transcriptional regulator